MEMEDQHVEDAPDPPRLLLHENKKTLIKKTKFLVEHGFPVKILNLDMALEELHNRSLSGVHQELEIKPPEPRARKYARRHYYRPALPEPEVEPSNFVCVNNAVEHAIGRVKSYIEQLTNDANLLKMWIASLPPNVADKSEAQTIKGTINNDIHQTCDQLMKLFGKDSKNRADIVQSFRNQKPEVIRRAFKDIDEKMYLSMKSALVDLRNHYSVLEGLLTKHFDKIMTEADPEKFFL